jgi:hypothetical protein
LDYILKKLYIRENISNEMLQINECVDDVIIISRNLQAFEKVLEEPDKAAQAQRLIINQ